MKKAVLFPLLLIFSIIVKSQEYVKYEIVKDLRENYYPSLELKILNPTRDSNGNYHFKLQTPIPFTAFGVGWDEPNRRCSRGDFLVKYRTAKIAEKWNNFHEEDAFVSYDESPTNLYWTNVLFGHDEFQHQFIEVIIKVPPYTELGEIRVSIMDLSKDVDLNWQPRYEIYEARNCPAFPAYIPRSDWCGSYTACHNPTYTSTYINPTHVVIHHGASPDTYTDGAAVVRSYWNYHVNTLGWNDIGYNYLTDKYGNLYQGRKNAYLNPSNYKDVLGAHAGASNPYSIGVNFLGNSDVTNPTTPQLDKCAQLLAWWFNHYGFDPTSSATIVLQSGGSAVKPRICGHRDVNIGGTTCPGDALYNLLPSIRTNTKAKINACGAQTDNIAPTTSVTIDGNVINDWRGTDFWVDFSDYDNPGGSGVNNAFYQILDYNGNEWRANSNEGFFNDNFQTSIHPEWTIVSGNWNINSGSLVQSDESLTNPNIYASVTQTSDYTYLYHFAGKISGTKTNKRFGIFFFCSDASQTYRGNAYMVYFRNNNGSCQYEVYKSTNNSISGILASAPITLNLNTWYDFKITYNPSTGVIKTYINNTLVGSYTDPSPLQSGQYISLRNGECIAYYDDLKVRRTRDTREKVTVGNNQSKQVRFESPSPTQDACRINTLLIDSANNWSSVVSKSIYIDWTSPTTSISTNQNWQTQNFQITFNDNDNSNGSGISRRFYLVSDYNGNRWKANPSAGFFYDDFDNNLQPEWRIQTGTWSIVNNTLVQSNESLTNTNIWTYLKQDLSNRYLYEFDLKIEGTGNNRRGGFHFMCDNPTLTNRGNSYFVWFRLELKTLEFYKVYNDVFEQVKVLPCDELTAGTWFNVKTIFDRITGEMFVYFNNKLIGEWKDDSPFTSGNYVSFRSGNSKLSVNNFRVFRTRTNQANITIGDTTAFIRYQNPSPSMPAAKVYSIVSDNAQNLSNVSTLDLNIDWTPPSQLSYINDGTNSSYDIDTLLSYSQISANWSSSSDNNSGINSYWYCIGTTPGGNDVKDWTNNNLNTSFTLTNMNLQPGQTYYVSVKVKNNAGLFSDVKISDGQKVPNRPIASFTINNTPICQNSYIQFTNTSSHYTNVKWYFEGGNPEYSINNNPTVFYQNPGTFNVTLTAYGPIDSTTHTTQIIVNPIVNADFIASNTTLVLPNANVQFNNLTSSGADNFLWLFGDGQTSTLPNPTHSYQNAGTYSVTLIAYDSECGNDTITKQNYISVHNPVIASFTSNQTSVCSGETINFTNNSQEAIQYLWSFPGGNPSYSTEINPSVTYNTPGSYDVILIASNNISSDTIHLNSYITVHPKPEIINYQVNNETSCNSGDGSIIINATGNGTLLYSVNNGNSWSNSNSFLSLSFGTYIIAVKDGNNCITSGPTVQITSPGAPASPTLSGGGTFCQGQNIPQLLATPSSNGIIKWYSDMSLTNLIGTGNTLTPFNNIGTTNYYATETVGNCTSPPAIISVTINPLPLKPSKPNGPTDLCQDPVSSIYTISSTQYAQNHSWFLQPANAGTITSNGLNANVLWNSNFVGNAYIFVQGQNTCGLGPISDTLIVNIKPQPQTPSTPIAPQYVCNNSNHTIVTGQQANFATNYEWKLYPTQAGNISTSTNPLSATIIWNANFTGIAKVSYRSVNNCGVSEYSPEAIITVLSSPFADFHSNDTILFLPNAIASFVNLSQNANNYLWYFGDGSSSNDFSPQHQYTSPGYYTVTLIASNNACSDTIVKENYIKVDNLTTIINNFESTYITLFPNPTNKTTFLTISGNTTKIKVTLSDVTGKEWPITESNKISNSLVFIIDKDKLNLSQGIYFIKVHTDSKTSVLKLFVN